MTWFKPKPFRSSHDAAVRMVDLLAVEGELAGTPLSDKERSILASHEGMSEELSSKAQLLVGRILDKQTDEDPDPRSFDNAMIWAGDAEWPNVAEVTAQVATERNPSHRPPRLALAKDKIKLVGCGFITVFLLMLLIALVGRFFNWK